MSQIHLRRGRSALAVAVSLSVLGAAVATAAGAAPKPEAGNLSDGNFSDGNYVVLLADTAAGAYEGGVPGFEATRPEKGRAFGKGKDKDKTKKYEGYLRGKQQRLLDDVGADAQYTYTAALNGFAATLTAEQAAELAGEPGVLAVTKDVARSLDTVSSPEFLGLTGPSGVWAGLGSPSGENAGSGIVIGVLDSGIWPESASFAGDKLKNKDGPEPYISDKTKDGEVVSFDKSDGTTFTGLCQGGKGWKKQDCSTKLISARYFDDGFVANVGKKDRSPNEFLSARDGEGHGSHTASTAAGNAGVAVSIDGQPYGTAAGMAPGAKIAAYKVCWEDKDPATGGCYTSDSVAAIDQAVQDGVDVLNFSVAGATDTVVDAVQFAFFNAAAAGVFVAASAGNTGPSASTVAHNSPWVTTVAASTHRRLEGTVVLGDGSKLKGVSFSNQAVPSTSLVASASLAAGDDARLCAPGSLPPVSGKIVQCDRGVYNRTDKSAEVERAGGVAMVLTNTAPASLDADLHVVPTVHLSEVAGASVQNYLTSAATPTASLEVGDTTGGAATPVPQIAPFSSRGPAIANDGDLLKPDITAPGVSVIAALAPPSNNGRDFGPLSGTSMSSPHVAGLGALLLQRSPLASPMAIKSVMMTSAYDLKSPSGAPATDPFAQGAGHVDPTRFADPGLLVLSGVSDWERFYVGQGFPVGPDSTIEPMAARDLNVPSIAANNVSRRTTITRTFTSLGAGDWDVDVDVPGFKAKAAKRLRFSEAQDQELSVTFIRKDAPLGSWAKGFVTLSKAGNTVRVPVVLRPVA